MPTVIKCIVHDKRVVEVLRALKPYTIDPPVVEPMDDGQPGLATKIAPPGAVTKIIFDFVEKAAKAGKKTITSRELKEACLAAGLKNNSYSYGLKLLLENKKLKRTKLPSTYEVIK